MDRTAIEAIQDLSAVAENSARKECYFPVATVANNTNIESLEKYQQNRYRFRGRFATTTLADFIEYVKTNDGKLAFINKDMMSAKTVFDMADLGHCEHKASLAMVKSPEFSAVLDRDGFRTSQQDTAEFLEDWKHNIEAIGADGKDMKVEDAIKGIRLVTVDAKITHETSVQQMGTNKSAMESIEATTKDKPLPAWLEFTCKPYEGFKDRKFMFRLSLTFSRGDPQMVLRLQNLDKHKNEMANELATLIKKGLPNVGTYLGTMDVS